MKQLKEQIIEILSEKRNNLALSSLCKEQYCGGCLGVKTAIAQQILNLLKRPKGATKCDCGCDKYIYNAK